MPDAQTLWRDVQRIRADAPLIHNITNYVVMNSTANALLCLGASPVMAHAPEEVDDMVSLAGALVINIGTLSASWIESMEKAIGAASRRELPWVLDPVGAGATSLRTQTAIRLLGNMAPAVIRGNASEIMALHGAASITKGVESVHDTDAALASAMALADAYHCVVSVSGETDLVTNSRDVVRVKNGHALMPRVTGLGCTATALTGAFLAINPDPLEAASHAMGVMGIAGEMAMDNAVGPGTLQLHFLDALYALTETDVRERLRMSLS